MRTCYAWHTRSMPDTIIAPRVISQRELRNNSGDVLRRVAAGESFIITNDGVEVAELIPRNAPRPKPAPDQVARAPKGAPFPFEKYGPGTWRSPDGLTLSEALEELSRERWEGAE